VSGEIVVAVVLLVVMGGIVGAFDWVVELVKALRGK
jgi:hypothetical protein